MVSKVKRVRRIWTLLALAVVFWTVSHEILKFKPLGGRPRLRLLVSYVYFESDLQDECEALNKRTNLAFFVKNAVLPSPENIKFLFNVPGNVPSINEILHMTGFSLSSDEGKVITDAMENKLSNVRFVYSAHHRVPDLCQHYHAIKSEPRHYDYYLFLNDGARGPFLRNDESGSTRSERPQQVRAPTRILFQSTLTTSSPADTAHELEGSFLWSPTVG